ncbi:hypothetical protein GQ53DRAFT_814650 [Thozetella sp. PMI_491]|nr:hypothetical protein GQ53DRAFT_814650 [Thozetella sp. PMI_491]
MQKLTIDEYRDAGLTKLGRCEEMIDLHQQPELGSPLPEPPQHSSTVVATSPTESSGWNLPSSYYQNLPSAMLNGGETLSPQSDRSPRERVWLSPLDNIEAYDMDAHSYNVRASSPKSDLFQTARDPSSDSIWVVIDEFFDSMYVVFPIISYLDVAARIVAEPDWTALPSLRTLLLSMRLLNAAASYRIGSRNKDEVCSLIRQVEASRLTYDFSDPPTLDAVACALFLFTAYNVLDKHNRAFLYLDEALNLFEAGLPFNEEEAWRTTRMGQVLFNTETATVALYGTKTRRVRALNPSAVAAQCSSRQSYHELTKTGEVAAHLLDILTRINLAEDSDGLEHIPAESQGNMEIIFRATVPEQHQYSRIQAADVLITRQWQLSSKLTQNLAVGRVSSPVSQASLESIGIIAMSWTCALKDGELRIIGLAKLAGLAQNINKLAIRGECQHVLHGLVGAIMREDHERQYAPLLTSILPHELSIPRTLGLQNKRTDHRHVLPAGRVASAEPAPTELINSDLFSWALAEEPSAEFFTG